MRNDVGMIKSTPLCAWTSSCFLDTIPRNNELISKASQRERARSSWMTDKKDIYAPSVCVCVTTSHDLIGTFGVVTTVIRLLVNTSQYESESIRRWTK